MSALAQALLRQVPGDAVLVLPAGDMRGAMRAADTGTQVFVHHPPPPPWPDHGIPVVLGADDRDVVVRLAGGWPGGAVPACLRQRRLDTLYFGPLGLLVLGDPASAVSVLAGAETALRRDRPAVLLDLRGGGDRMRAEVMDRLPGYRWLDVPGPCDCALPAGRPLPVLAPGAPEPPAVVVPFTHSLACAGLHPPEPDQPAGGRWTGAGVETWFMLPRPPGTRFRLALDIADWGNAPDGFAIRAGGRRLPPARRTAAALHYGPFAAAPDGGPVLRVALFPPPPVADLIRWPRKIGIRIAAARLSPA